ncbi:phage portal protein family protein [Enterococcus hailinensis]|uniref:phage portal protein family protein n=1 Tax=Enterococcus hailinensis TaxID=3238988 RepID=UPI0038B3BF50
MRKVIGNIRKDTLKKVVAGKFESGRQTKAKWDYGFLKQLDQPIKRELHREKKILDSLKLLRDINPDASMAVWNFLRLGNQGHEVQVFSIDGENDEEMQRYINEELAPRLGKIYGGGTDQLVNVLNLAGFTYGAVALEVELDKTLTEIVDFHPIQPSKVDFIPKEDTGELELCQRKPDGTWLRLNPEQVFYVPLDPDIDDPYGRSPMLPALEAVIFQAEVLNDLRTITHKMGYPRFDVSVSTEAIVNNIPERLQYDKDGTEKFINEYMDTIESAFAEIDIDDDFYHDDTIKVEQVSGMGGKSIDFKSLLDILDRQVTVALKQLPIMLGQNQSTTETHGSIQWEIQVAGIRSIQNMTKRLLEKAYTVALRVKGSQSSVSITFNEVRSKDRQAEATAEATEINNWISKVNQGWIDNDEAANEMVGHDAVAEPKQRQAGYSDLFGNTQKSKVGEEEDDEGRQIRRFPSEIFLKEKAK